MSEEIPQFGGQLCKKFIPKGEQHDNEDCLIAATALLENEQIVTQTLQSNSKSQVA